MSSQHAADEAEILAYYDAIATYDRSPESEAEHFDDLLRALVLAAIDRDRDLLAYVVRAGIERGRGDVMRAVCGQHNDEVACVSQAWAELRGVLTPLRPWGRNTTGEDS